MTCYQRIRTSGQIRIVIISWCVIMSLIHNAIHFLSLSITKVTSISDSTDAIQSLKQRVRSFSATYSHLLSPCCSHQCNVWLSGSIFQSLVSFLPRMSSGRQFKSTASWHNKTGEHSTNNFSNCLSLKKKCAVQQHTPSAQISIEFVVLPDRYSSSSRFN